MSYNISTIEYIGPGRLTITATDLGRAMIELQGKTPEGCFVDDTMKLRPLSPDVLEVTRIDWCGEGANKVEDLRTALSHTQGLADLLLIWEGGDSMTGLRVNDGEVTAHDVDIRLGDEAAE